MTLDWSSDVNHCLVPTVLCLCFLFFFCLILYVNVLHCAKVSLPFTRDKWGPWIIFGLTKYFCVWLREALPPDINLYENIEIKGVCMTNGLFLKEKRKIKTSHGLRRRWALLMVTESDNAACSCFFTWLAVQICWSLTINWHENEMSWCDLFGSKLFTSATWQSWHAGEN